MNPIVNAVVSLSAMGLCFGAGLAYASQKFAVEVDPKEEAILNTLPGANCGGCGFPGCGGLAAAIAKGDAPVNACPVGGAEVANAIAEIMGVTAGGGVRMIANVICKGTNTNAKNKSLYSGILDCKAAAMVAGGPKTCSYGCMGLGSCERVCPFDAIHVLEDGIAHVDPEKCVACGKCIEVCPKAVIAWIPYGQKVSVDCNSKDKGKDVKDGCAVGCIGCQMCVKSCPFDAFTFENNLAKIDYTKCKQCMICVGKCPTKAIRGIIREKKPAAPKAAAAPKAEVKPEAKPQTEAPKAEVKPEAKPQ
ncbi:MAG: Fe-S cluster domain-containing protein, partial [Peptostreptococcaceae bacterium]|nr:Fe-S cluster domain-containing protein [Peptostreptococcaceae bacterium]